MDRHVLIQVASHAARSPRQTRRVMYAIGDRPTIAPRGGVVIEGFPYEAGEPIPSHVIHVMDSDERQDLMERIAADKKPVRSSSLGQRLLDGMKEFLSSKYDNDMERREAARWFSPRGVILNHANDDHKPYYGAMYDWMLSHFRDWIDHLTSDQRAMATFDRTVRIGEMNKYLEDKRSYSYGHTGDAIEEAIQEFDHMIDKAPPLDRDTMVYKGDSTGKRLGTTQTRGSIFNSKEILSTSIDPRTSINGFLGTSSQALLTRIMLPKGTRVAGVTAEQIDAHGRTRKAYINSPTNYEQELTLPRDSAFRYVTEPHTETFIDEEGRPRNITVADLELIPQPSPEEAPHLPHTPIKSFVTGGRQGYHPGDDDDDDDYDDDSDPWEHHDPHDMKSDKESELETIFDNYQDDPGHDAPTLSLIEELKTAMRDIDHTDYSDPHEFYYAMSNVLAKAEKLVQDAPDHTEELWAAFQPQREIHQALEKVDATISRFARNHDTSQPVAAEYLKQLEFIRDRIATSADENLRDSYDHPVNYVADLDKYLAKARDVSRIGHGLYQEQLSGKPPLFLGDTLTHEQLVDWVKRKNEFDNHVEKLRQTNPELADRVQGLWDKASHGMTHDNASKTFLNILDAATDKYASGASPDISGYGYPVLSQLERKLNHAALVHKSMAENIARAKAMGIFQGGDWSTEDLKDWAHYHYEFNKHLSDYRKKQEASGNPILPQAGQAQSYWDKATKELTPSFETTGILTRLVDYAKNLKNGHVDNYLLEDIKSRLNSRLVFEGSPSVKLAARLEQLNDQYQAANKHFQASKYYHEDYSGYREKFQDYIKSKGIPGTTAEHINNLTPESQEQVFAQAKNLINNLRLATTGNIHPAQIWPQPAEEATPGTKVMDQLRFKAAKQKILNRFQDAIFTYNKLPHYDTAYHTHLNNLMQEATTNYKEGPDQLHVMKDVVKRAEGLVQGEPGALALLYDPLPKYGQKPSKVVQFVNKMKEFEEVINSNSHPPDFNVGLYNELWKNELPAKTKNEFNQGTPEQKQAILDHMDTVIAKAKAPVAIEPDWPQLFQQKREEFRDIMSEYMKSPGYSQDTHHNLGQAFWNKKLPQIALSNYLHATPEVKQATLDHFDDMIWHARNTLSQATPPADRPEPTKFLTTHFFNKQDWQNLYESKVKEYTDAIEDYTKSPEYDKKQHIDLTKEFFMHNDPDVVKENLEQGTPESNQLIVDHLDKVIAHAKTLAGQTTPLPVAAPQSEDTVYASYVANSKEKPMPDWQAMYDQTMGQSPEPEPEPEPEPANWDALWKSKVQAFKDLKQEYTQLPDHSKQKLSMIDTDFFMHGGPKNLKIQYHAGTPEQKQAILNHFDNITKVAQKHFGIPTSVSPEATQTTPTAKFSDYGITQDIHSNLYSYAKKPWVDPAQIDQFKDRYAKLKTKWSQEPVGQKDDVHYMAQLTHLHNDIVQAREEHSEKLDKIDKHAVDLAPKLASLQGVAELEQKFPQAMNQIHLDMENYKRSPHFDELHYGLLTDILDGTGKHWEDKKDHKDAQEDLKGLMRFTKKAATDNGKLPHQLLIPSNKEETSAPKPVAPVEEHGEIRRLNYGRINYGRSDQIKAALNQVVSKNTPLDLTPHDHPISYNSPKDAEAFARMHHWQMGHYGNFVENLSPAEQAMLTFNRAIKIGVMNRYLGKKKMTISHPSQEQQIQRGIQIMNGVIDRAPPLTHDLIVYRGGRKIDPADAPEPGSIIHSPGFASTSLNANVSRDGFSSKGLVFRIHVPKGTRMGPVSAYQIHEQGLEPHENAFKGMEQELLLGPGHSFRVTHPVQYNPKTNIHHLNVQLLPQGPPSPGSLQFP